MTPNQMTIFITIASFLIGCAEPILHGGVARLLHPVFALFISLGICSAGLIYLSTHNDSFAPFIVGAFVVGVGLVRLVRKEI